MSQLIGTNCLPYVATDCPGCAPNYGSGYMFRPHRDSCPVAIDAREKQRQRDHHEFMLMVAGKAFDRPGAFSLGSDFPNIIQQARYAADLAYPPPSAAQPERIVETAVGPLSVRADPSVPPGTVRVEQPKAPPWPAPRVNMNCPHVGCPHPQCDGQHEIHGPSAALSDEGT